MDLEQTVLNYQPPETAVATIRHTKIALLVGISGAGKDTIKTELLKLPDFFDVVSHTTRAPRSNMGVAEIDGEDYHFINNEQALSMLHNNEFVEAKFVHGTVYGTSIAEVLRAGEKGIAITDIDVQGVSEYKDVSNEVIAVFILPPSYDIWIERLKKRYATDAEFEAEWPKRRNSAIDELEHALSVPYYHCVINDDLERAVRVTSEIAHKSDVFNRKDDEARLLARDLLQQIKAN
ncbi:MAG: hypothetical protein WAQ27_03545 [Candidatus Microsaccharimonas sp.]